MFSCVKCGESKETSEFPKDSSKRGHRSQCKLCYAEYMRNYYKKNPQMYAKHKKYVNQNDNTIYKEKRRSWNRHHLTEAQYQELLEKFNGLCWICATRKAEHIDHNHTCCSGSHSCGNCVRGLLCGHCNRTLGMMEDNPDLLRKAATYLEMF